LCPHVLSWWSIRKPAHNNKPGSIAIVASADGKRFMLTTPVPLWTQDRGKDWHAVKGLPQNTRPVADKRDPAAF
jgi:hypothetical protein